MESAAGMVGISQYSLYSRITSLDTYIRFLFRYLNSGIVKIIALLLIDSYSYFSYLILLLYVYVKL